MEEELGNVRKCREILDAGLSFNRVNENLFLKKIKVEEKIGEVIEVRRAMALLKTIPLDRTWKIILEGALFEGRIGNVKTSRAAMKYLMERC